MHLEEWDLGGLSLSEALSETASGDLFSEEHHPPEKTLRVLVLEDDETDFLITKKALLYLDSYSVDLDWETSVFRCCECCQKEELRCGARGFLGWYGNGRGGD